MRLRFKTRVCLLLLLSTTLFSCTKLNDGSPLIEIERASLETTEEKDIQPLISVGYASIAAQKGASFDLQMLNAIKVSKLEAYKEMAEQLYGVLVSAENNIDGAQLQDDLLKSRVKGLVRGAKVLRSYHQGELYITELELDLKNSPFAMF